MYRTPTKPGNIGGYPWASHGIVWGFFVVGNAIATQYAASRIAGLMPLGSGLRLGGATIYQPFGWMVWFFHSSLNDKAVTYPLLVAMGIAVGSFFLGGFIANVQGAARLRKLSEGSEDIHGSARWAEKKDMRDAGLLNRKEGLFVGGWVDEQDENMLLFLRHTGPEHVIAIAPPRSGKGVSLVIPVLLDHPANVVVHDTKGELWQATAGYRAAELGHRCIKFSPKEASSDGYNPFAEVRLRTVYEVSDVANIMNMLVRTTEVTGASKHWVDAAESFGIGVALHVLYAKNLEGKVATPIDLYDFLTPYTTPAEGEDCKTIRDILEESREFAHDPKGLQGWKTPDGLATQTHPEVRRHFTLQINRAPEEFDGVVSELSTAFLVFSDPLVAKATSHSDFRLTDLMNSARPISLYITIPPSDKERLQPLLRLLFTQIIQRNTETMDYQRPSTGPKDRLLLMMDEAGSLGRLKILADALVYTPGYHIQAFLIFHSVGQIHEHYSHNNAILGSTHVKIAFAPNTKETAEYLSDMTGKTTQTFADFSHSSKGFMGGSASQSGHVTHVARPLLVPDEVSRMRSIKKTEENRLVPGDMLIFMAGQRPIFGTQMIYLADPELTRRSLIPPPSRPEAEESDLERKLLSYVD